MANSDVNKANITIPVDLTTPASSSPAARCWNWRTASGRERRRGLSGGISTSTSRNVIAMIARCQSALTVRSHAAVLTPPVIFSPNC